MGLIITCDSVAHTVSNPLGLPYNSGVIVSCTEPNGEPAPGLFSFTYGLFETYALLPGTPGPWTGIVLYPLDGGAGELDIEENGGSNTINVFQSIHYQVNGQNTGQSVTAAVSDYTQNWHNYAVNWQPDFITWYVDGVQTAQIATPANFINRAYYIAIDFAIQGNPNLGFDGVPDATSVFPSQMQIQWVRVSQGTTTIIAAGALVNFTGTLQGYTTAPALTYTINNAPPVAMTGVTATGWNFQFNAPNSAGTYVLKVSDGTTTGSVSFSVGSPSMVITPLAPTSPVAGQSFTFSGTLAGYTTIPSLTYSINNGTAVALTGVSITGWAQTLTISSAGSYTIVVSDAAGVVTGSVTFTVAAASTILRTWYKNPGMDGSFWVQPFANSANWITSGSQVTAVRGSGCYFNVNNYSAPWYMGQASDPLVTVTNGTHSIVVHIPLGATIESPVSAVDQSIGGADATQPYLVWSISGATMTVNGVAASAVAASGTVITGTYGFAVNDGSGLIMVDAVTGQQGDNNSIGGIQDYELAQATADPNYVIQHMLAWHMDAALASNQLAWPLLVLDGSVPQTGPLPQGLTIGIPANVARPQGQTRGFYLLWDNLQQYGWFNYNFGYTSNKIEVPIFTFSGAYSSLIADLQASANAVIANVCILNYASGVSGAQYSLATTKGATPGSLPAFTPPPPLDLSPTGGVNVAPSTFGAWYPSGYNATPTNSTTGVVYTISPTTPSNVTVNTAFSFTGSLLGYTTAPTLTYSINNGTAIALNGVTSTGWATSLTLSVSGTVTILVTDAAHSVSGSTSFAVSSGGNPPPVTVTFNSADTAGGIALSNNSYTATATGSTSPDTAKQGIRATAAIQVTKTVMWEMTFSSITQNCSVGLSNALFVQNGGGGLGGDGNGIGFYPATGAGSQPPQSFYLSGNQLSVGNGVASVAPVTVTCVVNSSGFYASTPAMRSTSGVQFNNSTTANPATNTGGFSISSLGATYYPTFNTLEGGGVCTINDGTTSFSAFGAAILAANPSFLTLSGQTPAAPSKAIAPNAPVGVVVGTPFTFSGTLTGYTATPNLTYSINGATPIALGGVTSTSWSTSLTIGGTGTYTISVTDGSVTGTTGSFQVSTSGSTGSQVPAPLQGNVTTGSWVVNQRISVSAMPNGFMQYNYLLPAQYNPNYLYPILFFGHTDYAGMSGGSYPLDGTVFTQVSAWLNFTLDSVVNTVAFRTAYPCIVVAPQCDQTLGDTDPNGNFGGYNDSTNSGGNEQAVTAIAQYFITNFPVDPGRRYVVGTSLGAIGALAWIVDNNIYNGVNRIWTAAVGLSEQLYRPTQPNANVFPNMTTVPYLAISTPSDNSPTSYDQPAWQYYTGNSNFPQQSAYDSGGMPAIRAGTSQFYYIDEPGGAPWQTLLKTNADGGDGTTWWNWLFGLQHNVAAPQITGASFAASGSIIANSSIGTQAGALTVASSGGALTGVTYTLNSTTNFSVTTSGAIQFNNSAVAADSYALTVKVTASNASNSPQSYPFTVVVTSNSASGAFSIQGGKVISPAGSHFVGRGVAIHDSDLPNYVTNAACQPLTTMFPGINMLRVFAETYWGPTTYQQQITWLTAQNIVVVLEDGLTTTGNNVGGGDGYIFTGTMLTNELNWFSGLATQYKNNTYVWFGTNNEPSIVNQSTGQNDIAALWTWQQQTYNAIRNTGNNNIIEIEQPSPYIQGAYAGLANTVFSQMKNIVYGPHFYDWIWNGAAGDPGVATIYSSPVGSTNSTWGGIVQQVANLQTLTSLDGIVPVGCFEFSPGTDAGGPSDCNAVFEAVNTGVIFCFLAWAINTSAGLILNDPYGGTGLTSPWGTTVASQILSQTGSV